MIENAGRWSRRLLRHAAATLVLSAACIFLTGPGNTVGAQEQAEYGYMLIRVHLSARERVDVLAMTNVETKESVRLHDDSFETAGINAYIALVPIKAGRYFLSEYQPQYGISTTENRQMAARQTRSDPGAESNTFEIVSGVVNYVGDWTLLMDASRRMSFDPTVEFDKTTLETYLTEYPDQASQFEIYLSPMGGQAVSINELAQ